jgi:hypothetical protein
MRFSLIDRDPVVRRMSEQLVEAIARLYEAAATGDAASWERWALASREMEEVFFYAQQMGLSCLKVIEILQPDLKDLAFGQEELRHLASLLAGWRLGNMASLFEKTNFFKRFLLFIALIGTLCAGTASLASAHTPLREQQALSLVQQAIRDTPQANRLVKTIQAHTPQAGYAIYAGEEWPDHVVREWTFWVDPANSTLEVLEPLSDRWVSLSQWGRGL